MASIKDKTVRVKATTANVKTYVDAALDSPVFDVYDTGQEIGTATGNLIDGGPVAGPFREFVEVLVDVYTYGNFGEELISVKKAYVLRSDVDILGDDITADDGTVVVDESGNQIGTLNEYPNAIKTGKQTATGKEIYVVVPVPTTTGGTEPTRPKWMNYVLIAIGVLAVTALGFIIYRTAKSK